jgi:CheY-like chemotaxis protein
MIEEPARDRPLVLVADDEEDILTLVSFRLEQAGYEVVEAMDGNAALQLAKELAPDLAVIDVMMPRKDGYEVVEGMRADAKTSRIPVILLTARVQEADVERGFAVGADGYIKKPFSPEELRSSVQAVIGSP